MIPSKWCPGDVKIWIYKIHTRDAGSATMRWHRHFHRFGNPNRNLHLPLLSWVGGIDPNSQIVKPISKIQVRWKFETNFPPPTRRRAIDLLFRRENGRIILESCFGCLFSSASCSMFNCKGCKGVFSWMDKTVQPRIESTWFHYKTFPAASSDFFQNLNHWPWGFS